MPNRSLVCLVAFWLILLVAAPAAAAAPNTTITSGPKGAYASQTAAFRFKASISGATFQCKLDGGTWRGCASPQKYRELAQGSHTFRVRAVKAGAKDPTPAARNFTVDTVRPDTTIESGPSGEVTDPTPTFTFTSTEPGTFQCKVLASLSFTKCSSPFTPVNGLQDGEYNFEVRSRDAAGNVDKTPDSRPFSVETPLTTDLATAEAAAAMYFPDEMVIDAEAFCSSPWDQTTIDCPSGPLPPSDQLRITSTRTVEAAPSSAFDVTIASDVQTLRPVALSYGDSFDCVLAMTSAHGDSPTWETSFRLQFENEPSSGRPQIALQSLDVLGVELADWGLSPWDPPSLICGQIGIYDSTYMSNVYQEIVRLHMVQIGVPMCAAAGPKYLGPCPS